MDTERESTHKVSSGEENPPATPAGIRTRNLSITSPALYKQAIPVCGAAGVKKYRQSNVPRLPESCW